MAKLFEKQRTNFYYNWLSFIEDFLKSFLVCFLMGHSVYTSVNQGFGVTVLQIGLSDGSELGLRVTEPLVAQVSNRRSITRPTLKSGLKAGGRET